MPQTNFLPEGSRGKIIFPKKIIYTPARIYILNKIDHPKNIFIKNSSDDIETF